MKKDNRKSILVTLPRPIFPQVCGYAFYNKKLLEALSAACDVRVVLITGNELSVEEKSFYREHGITVTEYRIPKWKSLYHTLLALFGKVPLQVAYYYDRKLQKMVDGIAPEVDGIFSVLVRTKKYAESPAWNGKTKLFLMADSIALNYERSKEKTKSLFWKWIYSLEAERLKRYEKRCIEDSSRTFLFNQEEVAYWSQVANGNIQWLPHGVNEKLFHYEELEIRQDGAEGAVGSSEASDSDKKVKETKAETLCQASLDSIRKICRNAVVFMGKMDYQPNVDAAMWYLRNVQPLVDDIAGFVIVGAYPKKELLEEAEKFRNVHVTGFVEDPYRYAYESCGMVAPMQTGGGIQNKVLEGMALGKVNIVSSLAAGPIVGAKHGENMFIVDDPAEYVRVVKDLVQSKNADSGIGEKALLVQGSGTIEDGEGLKSEDQYTKIEKNARNLIRNQFTWERYKSVLLETVKDSCFTG